MDNFIVRLSPGAVRALDRLEDKVAQEIFLALSVLSVNPFPSGKRIKKIKGKRSVFYRLRVDKYRVFYSIEMREVIVLEVVGKKDAERFIKRKS